MAYGPAPECGNALNLCRGDCKWSGFWGRRHNFCSTSQSIPISNRRFVSTLVKRAPSCVCFWEDHHLSPSENASVFENGACSSRPCSLPFANGVYHDFPVSLFSPRAFVPPCQTSSLKTSKLLQRGLITFRRPGRWVCFGGGPRPKKPRVWKTRNRRGTVSKSQKLLDHVRPLSNVKEEVYGALDAFIAWEIEFPLVAVKKALHTLKSERNWQRIIQISKWMVGKGQGKTLGTYLLLLEAFDHEGRIEEAQDLWERVVTTSLSHTPRIFFSMMISLFDRHQMYDELLEVFADMEELEVKPSPNIVNKVAIVYEKLGIFDKAEKVKAKYPPAPMIRYRTINGRIIRISKNSTLQGEPRRSLEEINATNFSATDAYGSSVDEDICDNAEEEDFGDSESLKDEVVGTDTRQAAGEEVQFA